MSKEEEKLYPEIKEWLQQYLTDKYKGYAIETTFETSKMVSGLSVNRLIACELRSPLTIFERAQKYTAISNKRQTSSAGQ